MRLTRFRVHLALLASLMVVGLGAFPQYAPPMAIQEPAPVAAPDVSAPAPSEPVTLVFGGDTMASGLAARTLKRVGPERIFGDVQPLLRDADLAILNLETALGSPRAAHRAPAKEFAFHSANGLADALAAAGVDVVSVANNHAYDFGLGALQTTRATLSARGIETAGAGANDREAYAAVTREVRGRRIAVVALSRVVPVGWEPSAKHGGIASAMSMDRAAAAVGDAARDADVTIAFLHWGLELSSEATQSQRRVARLLVDAGADLVIGSHPHVVQEMETYRGKLIAYSLGNLLFTVSQHDAARFGLLLSIAVDADGTQRARAIPTRIDGQGTHVAVGRDRASVLAMLTARSRGVAWEAEDIAIAANTAIAVNTGQSARATRRIAARAHP